LFVYAEGERFTLEHQIQFDWTREAERRLDVCIWLKSSLWFAC